MNPTPEQVAAWAREASDAAPHLIFGTDEWLQLRDKYLANLAFTAGRAWQAEQDAKLCEKILRNCPSSSYWYQCARNCAAAIRANAPKVTT